MSWTDISLGDDAGPHAARAAVVEDGNLLHGYVKFQRPGGKAYMLSATIDLRQIANMLESKAMQRGAVSGAAPLRKKLARLARKVGRSKLVKGIARVAKRVLDNPLVKGIMASNPFGQAFLAVRAAGKVAADAVRGSMKARHYIKEVAQRVKHGDRNALKVARLLKQGVKYSGIAKNLPMRHAVAGADEHEYLSEVLGSVARASDPMTVAAGEQYVLVAGDDGASDEHAIDAVDIVATSGAFEGVRWAAQRMGLHSMQNRPDEFSTRNALMLGHSVMAHSGHGGGISHEQYSNVWA